ncbi:MAG: sugar kinase [Chloroflexi bacterium]|nr:sugar kinase [Chloroflexota bacterium]
MPDLISLGECMVELFAEQPLAEAPALTKAFGGDSLNALVAAARLGTSTGYITVVGDDPFTPYLLNAWSAEGIDVGRVRRADRNNGLYCISILPGGQREFTYYRAGSAAAALCPGDLDPAYLAAARIVHATGVSQAISPSARRTVLEAYRIARQHGVRTSYDPNLRLRLWSLVEAQAALREVLSLVDIALPSLEDATALLGVGAPRAAVEQLWGTGVEIVAVKAGPQGCWVGARSDGRIDHIPALAVEVVDTSGAGDAFDGGFLHGLLAGLSVSAAARIGVITAGLKCRGRGAVASLPQGDEVRRVMGDE